MPRLNKKGITLSDCADLVKLTIQTAPTSVKTFIRTNAETHDIDINTYERWWKDAEAK
jgi:hypothetical protein